MGYLSKTTAAALFAGALACSGCGGKTLDYRMEFDSATGQCTSIRTCYRGNYYRLLKRNREVIIERADMKDEDRFEWVPIKKAGCTGELERAFSIKREDEQREPISIEAILK